MKVMLFGGTGMIGQGALRACFQDPDVDVVLAVGRSPIGTTHPKLHEVVERDLFAVERHVDKLTGYDACLWCLGHSAAGMDESSYTRVTHDLTLTVARVLVQLNPKMTFVFISGAGTDASEKGRMMWARIKGRTENALQRLPFKAVYSFRPGIVQPLDGIRSRTPAYRVLYLTLGPVMTLVRGFVPQMVLTTDNIGRAMLVASRAGAPKTVLEAADIYRLSLTSSTGS